MGNHHGEPRGIKSAPRRGGGGGGTESANCAGGAGILILHHPAPPVKSHLQALADLAAARAARDLAAAEAAKAQGDYTAFCRLRRRGLRHQVILYALQTALQKEYLL